MGAVLAFVAVCKKLKSLPQTTGFFALLLEKSIVAFALLLRLLFVLVHVRQKFTVLCEAFFGRELFTHLCNVRIPALRIRT